MSLAAEPLAAEQFEGQLADHSQGFGLSLSADCLARLARFLAELDVWRRRTNLTGPLSAAELTVHALESALGAALIRPESRVLDIGSGAGFPGIPIAIVRPDVRMSLLEPRARRIAFLRHVIRDVPVENAGAIQKRLETASFEDPFDCAVVRAVGNLASMFDSAPFLRRGGALLAWTTSPQTLVRELSAFTPGRALAVPASRRKVIVELLLRR